MEACEGSHAVVILTEWDCFKSYDYQSITQVMHSSSPRTFYDFRGIIPSEVLSKESSPFDKTFLIGVGWIKQDASE